MKHRALVIGAGRIGAGFKWHDDAYTHAGAYRALSDRVELVGFVEPDLERRVAANLKWNVPTYESVAVALHALDPDIVSVCVQPHQQEEVMDQIYGVKAVWCEKPWVTKRKPPYPVQVNYMRRGDPTHQERAQWCKEHPHAYPKLIVYGKDDIHTRCHFEDLAKWWDVKLDYRVFNGPCAYLLHHQTDEAEFFDNGGVDGGMCFRYMLRNLLDHVEGKAELWSPA